MNQTEAIAQVAILNEFLKSKPWLDVDVVECSPQTVVLDCGIDLSLGPDIEIRFESIYLASLLMTWKTDTSHPVLQLLTGEEAYHINRQYRVEQGYHLFAFQPEDIEQGIRCLIGAHSFSWKNVKPK